MINFTPLLKAYSHLPNLKGKNYLGNLLVDWTQLSGVHVQHMLFDFHLSLNLQDRIQRQMFIKRIYEPDTVANCIPFLKKSHTFFDVGANIGYFSLLAKAVNPRLQVYSFEPLPQNIECLKKNIALNPNFNIQIIEKCVSDKNGTTEFMIPPQNECGWGRIAYRDLFDGTKILRDVITIDDFCHKNQIQKVDFLKIDVEGFEFHVLKGAEKLLSSPHAPHICIEMNTSCFEDMGVSITEIFQFLIDKNYTLYSLSKDGSLAATSRPVENYLHLNYFAIKEKL